MTLPDLIVRGRRVVTPEGVRPATIHVRGGRIDRVGAYDEVPKGAHVIDGGTSVVMPGIVDTHVHVNEPGRTEWEGFVTATRAAAAGGVTTIIDMPLNSIPATTSRAALLEKIVESEGKSHVDIGFWGGIVPANARSGEEIAGMLSIGALGFKAFLVPSGVDEFPCLNEADLRAAMVELARRGAVLLVHAELPGPIEAAVGAWDDAGPVELRDYSRWLRSRPVEAEVEAVEMVIRLARETKCRVHIVHLSAPAALPALRAARAEGLPITVETCPHYLTFCAEEIPDGAVAFKCAPPIRSRADREGLWDALKAREIDLIASDHSPCPPEMKGLEAGDFRAAWGGISSLQVTLPAVWTAARERGLSVTDLAAWMCAAPARLAGISDRKGSIAPGRDADLVIWEPEVRWTIHPAALQHRHKVTPYAGRTPFGVIRFTLLRGETIYDDGALLDRPIGRPLLNREQMSREPRGGR
jgi:allantoinase